MTPQEQDMLKGLADRVNQTVLQDKDPEAEQFLNQSLSRNPDAVYILSQTVLVQQYALDQAKKQLDDLKQQLESAKQQAQQAAAQPVKHTSFLGGLLGHDDPPPPPPPPQYSQAQYTPVPNYAPPPPSYAQPSYSQPQYAAAPAGGSGGGFLRGALQTAGGVAAGALAFEGIESLMHGFGEHAGYGSGAGFGSFGGGGFGGEQPREEIINNYYGDSDRGSDRDRGGLSPDIEDRRDDNRADFADTSNDDNTSNDDFSDDTSSDDSSFDDSGTDDNSF
jgi:hypothetical protein